MPRGYEFAEIFPGVYLMRPSSSPYGLSHIVQLSEQNPQVIRSNIQRFMMLAPSVLGNALSALTRLPSMAALSIIFAAAYLVYYRYLHPLSKYPGPFWASVTDAWKAYQLSTLHLPEKLMELHQEYGEVVRVGPNDLSFRSADASSSIYKAGGRKMPKTSFYDGFTAFLPNLFGTQDEEVRHSRGPPAIHVCVLRS